MTPIKPLVLGVLADDLTGALASAARLHDRGITTLVLSEPDQLVRPGDLEPDDLEPNELLPDELRPNQMLHAQAAIINLGTRERSVEGVPAADRDARIHIDRARTATEYLLGIGCARIELRHDSMLRGQHALEMKGVIEALTSYGTPPVIVAVPSFPGADRTTINGHLCFTRDGHRQSVDVGPLLFGPADSCIVHHQTVTAGPGSVQSALRKARTRGISRFVADSMSDQDLRTIATAVSDIAVDDVVVTVSPGGWLRYYPAIARQSIVLCAIGSFTDINRRQIEYLMSSSLRAAKVTWFDLLGDIEHPDQLLSFLDQKDVLLITPLPQEVSVARASEVGTATKALLESSRRIGFSCRGIIATGGFTANDLCRQLSATVLQPIREVTPLCAAARIQDGPWTGLPLITKSGHVGSDNTLLLAAQALLGGPLAFAGHQAPRV